MTTTIAMGRKKTNRERVQITLPEGMADQLTAKAVERGWDRSRLIEELAAAYLKKQPVEARKPPKGK